MPTTEFLKMSYTAQLSISKNVQV